MKNFKTVTKTVTENVPTEIVCDRCGKIYKAMQDDFFSLDHQFGYGSKRDGDVIHADLCEHCLFEMLDEHNVKYQIINNEDISEYDGAI